MRKIKLLLRDIAFLLPFHPQLTQTKKERVDNSNMEDKEQEERVL